jgi:Tol biopolymer transport system component
MKAATLFLLGLQAVLLVACSIQVNDSGCIQKEEFPKIYPDYNGVTIPVNIAPLNFQVAEEGTFYQAVIASPDGKKISISSINGSIKIPLGKWRKMVKSNKGSDLSITVYVKDKTSGLMKFKPLKVTISNDEIDSHLAYRLINVGYILWNKLGLYQRDLTSFKETPIMLNRNTNGNCMNCHSFCQHNPDKMMFHMRSKLAGTVIVDGDEVSKVSTKTPYTMSAAAYPSWHPDGKHIAFSVDIINQWFHGVDKRNEVYDRASDIIVYDIDKNTITTSPKVSTKNRETLPTWSPDGKYIYYCSTKPLSDSIQWDEVKYSLCRISYDVHTNTWGDVDTVLTAAQAGGSISFPRISPDGEWLMFTRADHGYFTIFYPSSDLFLLNLKTKIIIPFPYNSDDVDSYHSWSSNGNWIVFSSKRMDGICTRPYFTHFDGKGNFSKPFVLPQKDPLFYQSFKNNFNVPELVEGPIKISKPKLIEAARSNAFPAQFDKNVYVDGLSGASKIEQSVLH